MTDVGAFAFARFREAFDLTPPGQTAGEPVRHELLDGVRGYAELATLFAGCSFSHGVYRIHDAQSALTVRDGLAQAFPEYVGRVAPFAFDWLGRQFVVDHGRRSRGQPLVLILEPGTGEVLEVPCGLADFHEQELIRNPNAALAVSLFAEWARGHREQLPLGHAQCVGYKLPLFLGGEDTVENLELSDLEVYWYMSGQLIARVAALPPGTRVTGVSIEPDP